MMINLWPDLPVIVSSINFPVFVAVSPSTGKCCLECSARMGYQLATVSLTLANMSLLYVFTIQHEWMHKMERNDGQCFNTYTEMTIPAAIATVGST